MRFRSHQCWFPRDSEKPRDYEDAAAVSEKWGRAAIADGVSAAIFSRIWARLLTRTAVAGPPDLTADEPIVAWLTPLQAAWQEQVRQAKITVPLWAVMPKITSIGGQATLLVVEVEPVVREDGSTTDACRLRAQAIGDSMLYVVHDGRKILSFPLTESKAFEAPPWAFSSLRKNVEYGSHVERLETECRVGDLLVLCTDAIGKWAMQEYEADRQVDWMRYWGDDAAWQADVIGLRRKSSADPGPRLVVDDCTLLLLEVVPEESVDGEPDIQPDRSDTPFVLLDDAATPAPAAADAAAAGAETMPAVAPAEDPVTDIAVAPAPAEPSTTAGEPAVENGSTAADAEPQGILGSLAWYFGRRQRAGNAPAPLADADGGDVAGR